MEPKDEGTPPATQALPETRQSPILWRFVHVYIPIALGAFLIHNGFTLIGAALIIWGLCAI